MDIDENEGEIERQPEHLDQNGDSIEVANEEDIEEPKTIRFKFRNYTPMSAEIRKTSKLPSDFATGFEDQNTVEKIANMIMKENAKLLEKTLSEIDINSLAPRRSNWDLKRDVEKKTKKLDRQTKRAIAELIRKRLMEEQALGK